MHQIFRKKKQNKNILNIVWLRATSIMAWASSLLASLPHFSFTVFSSIPFAQNNIHHIPHHSHIFYFITFLSLKHTYIFQTNDKCLSSILIYRLKLL